MRHPGGTRFERRLRERQEKRRLEEEGGRSEREKTVQKFGPPADERRVDRRQTNLSPQEVEAWLKHNGILGGDRRKAERRRR